MLAITEPGWRDYVKHRIKQMAFEYPYLYGELPKLVSEKYLEAMREGANGEQPTDKG